MMNEWTPLFIPTHVNFYSSAFRRRRHYVFGLSVRSLKCPLLTCTWVRWSTRPTVTVLRHVRPSVCPLTFRVRPVASTVLDGFFPYLVQMINSMRGCVACDDPWPWAISSKSFGLDLENRVCSVAYTVLYGFFLYLVQMITIIRGCVACYVFFRIWKFEFLENFFNFSAMTLKNKIYEWDLNCLVWVCCLNKVIAFLLSYFVLYNIVLYLTAIYWEYINCLKQDFSISNALAMEILQFCTN